MSAQELAKLAEGIAVLGGVAAIFYAVFKNAIVKQTNQAQKELIETLTTQVNELRTLHISNEKDIAELRGQVSVYKELPLKELAASMQQIAATQEQILESLKTIGHQNVAEQNVAHQTITGV